jgi:hypothetical protein
MEKLTLVTERMSKYLLSVGKTLSLIHLKNADTRDYIIKKVSELRDQKDIEPIVISATVIASDGQLIELLRWVFYDVEFVIYDRVNGKVGVTGPPENVKKCTALLQIT